MECLKIFFQSTVDLVVRLTIIYCIKNDDFMEYSDCDAHLKISYIIIMSLLSKEGVDYLYRVEQHV